MTLIRHPKEFYPRRHHTVTERLNALSRLVLYVTILAWAATSQSVKALVVGMVLLFVIALVQKNHTRPERVSEGFVRDPLIDPFATKDCRAPEESNPFMNGLLYDEDHRNGCRGAENEAERLFQKPAFQDPWDLFSKKSNTSRQWVTVPNRNDPQNRQFYLNWVYGLDGPTCKENTAHCDPVKTYGMNFPGAMV